MNSYNARYDGDMLIYSSKEHDNYLGYNTWTAYTRNVTSANMISLANAINTAGTPVRILNIDSGHWDTEIYNDSASGLMAWTPETEKGEYPTGWRDLLNVTKYDSNTMVNSVGLLQFITVDLANRSLSCAQLLKERL